MKKTIISLLFITLVIFLAASISYAHYNSAPNDYCQRCHQGGSAPAYIKVEGVPDSYVPGKKYKITVRVVSDNKSFGDLKGGFSVMAQDGKLIATDTYHTQISNGFLTHTIEGSALREWTFIWQAPKEKKRTKLFIKGVAANGDFSPAGDSMGATIIRLSPR
jgi:hypothetical protein